MIEFTVLGTPKPQGRPRAFSRGNFTKVYSPATKWRNDVKFMAAKLVEKGQEPLEGALMVHINYYFERPKAHYGTGKNSDKLKKSAPSYMTKRPDLDNLNKAVLDAMQDAGLLLDDSQIVTLYSTKDYKTKFEGATILIKKELPI
jgi:crossover junction endodeoxyribonuclease RusA